MATAPALTDLDRIASRIEADPAAWAADSYYPAHEWTRAVFYHRDGDSTDLLFMLERDEAFDRFTDWQARGVFMGDREAERREFTDFADWRAA